MENDTQVKRETDQRTQRSRRSGHVRKVV
ncbi:TPA: hypothetical protein I8522_001107 [Serratia marcescens]|nr:hypothetical protein [Serratia sp. 4542]QDI21290.1 hypothetical protein FBF86_15975 [Serratia marcescens]RNW03804.1 hypothetical protein CAG37_021960 [Serratia nematodiphila]TXE73353.1 hypothetical protein FOT59_08890 [Serratia nevei]QDI31034.1 hypothetical protein FG169_15975 [Serratia marcescens]